MGAGWDARGVLRRRPGAAARAGGGGSRRPQCRPNRTSTIGTPTSKAAAAIAMSASSRFRITLGFMALLSVLAPPGAGGRRLRPAIAGRRGHRSGALPVLLRAIDQRLHYRERHSRPGLARRVRPHVRLRDARHARGVVGGPTSAFPITSDGIPWCAMRPSIGDGCSVLMTGAVAP